jgi:sugar/nucleoside kinase (ribokinase family)
MTKKILGIGNAIVDIVSKTDDIFLDLNGLVKGTMSLIYDDQAKKLSELNYEKITSGGSAANTIALLSQIGCDTAFIGKVGNDPFGNKFIEEIEKTGTRFLNKNYHLHKPSARSFILVSKDSQRTMATYLGCAPEITDEDIKEEYLKDIAVLYLEGYLWDGESTILALKKAIAYAKKYGAKLAFSLSDRFCILRHKADFVELVQNDVDILFANEFEAAELLEQPPLNWPETSEKLQKFFATNKNLTAVVTRSANGCSIFSENSITEVGAANVANPVDSTGAGDAFAGGFLYGILNNFSLEKAGELGNKMGGMIIQKFGARFDEAEISILKSKS